MSPRKRKPAANPQNALLGDLESIRTLLEDDEDAPEAAGTDLDDLEVPVLEDVVESEADADIEPTRAREFGLDDDLFRALLSDEWRDSASEILKQAREAIGEHSDDWRDEETDAFSDALKVRIDAIIQGWMRGMVVTHMADLHQMLLTALSTELKTTIEDIIEHPSEKPSEKPDGQ